MDFDPMLTHIRDVLTAIREQRKLEDVVALIIQKACSLAGGIHGSFVAVDPATQRLVIESTYGEDWTEEKKHCELRVGEGLTGKVAATGKPYLSGNVLADPEYFPLFDNVKSELVVPIHVSGKVWGLINLDGLEENAFDAATLDTLTVFAELIAFAITLSEEMKEQDRLQKRLVQSEKLASLGRIIANIAHEINNPLTSILGHASLLTLKRGGAADEASIQAILAESKRTADLVKGLLAFSRNEVGQREIVGTNELIAQICGMKKYQLKVSNIRLVTELDDISYPISVCPQQIHQVLLNLINNAEQAIEPDRHDGTITLRSSRYGEVIYISIQDNGVGMSDDVQKMIFDPFFTTKPQGQGTGLGLSIAITIVEAHGGNLTVSSTPGRGSTFTIALPLAHLHAPIEEAETSPEPEPGRASTRGILKGRVLLVDDEAIILETLEAYLQMQRVETSKAKDGHSALELLKTEEFSVIVSDIRMPGMDGLEFYNRTKELHPAYARRFIFMSGDLVRESTKSFIASTGCGVLEKPFTLESIFSHIEPFLTRESTAVPEISNTF